MLSLVPLFAGIASATWTGWAGNSFNNHWSTSQIFTSGSAPSLTPHCYLNYPGGVSATPTIEGTIAYYPAYNGSFVALDYTSCQVQWQINVTQIIVDFGPISAITAGAILPVSRTSAQIDGDVLFFGTQSHALMVAVDKHTGQLLDRVQLNDHPLAIATLSPTFWGGYLLAGVSSLEEGGPLFFGSDFPCCTFIGRMIALTFNHYSKKLSIKWSIPTLPEGQGWSGAGVWGSQPAVDPVRRRVFYGTGNLYNYPLAYAHCTNETSDCLPTGVNQEAIIAVDIDTGHVSWVRRLSSLDVWNTACLLDPINTTTCPEVPPGPDADFGMAPSFVPHYVSGLSRDVVVVGQKLGWVYAFDATDGTAVWSHVAATDPGPDGSLVWGLAVDDERVYLSVRHSTDSTAANVSTSLFKATNLTTGEELWATTPNFNSLVVTGPTVAGDFVLFPRAHSVSDGTSLNGGLVVLDKSTGALLDDMELDSLFQGGIAVVDKWVMFGTGYRSKISTSADGSFYVLSAGH